MRKFRTLLSLPFVGLFFVLLIVTGAMAWMANLIAGQEGIVRFEASNGQDKKVIDEGSDWP